MHKIIRYIFLISVLHASAISAHDFWMEADPFYTEIGKTVDLSIIVGTEFIGDSLPNIPNWYSDFSRFKDNKKIPVEGELGRDPAGFFKPETNGTHIIGYQSDWTEVSLDPDTFLKYLKMEGLNHAIAYREKHQQNQLPGKETYIRHIKTLQQTGKKFDTDNYSKSFGYELEIYPKSNPYRKKLNDSITFKVLYQGKPEPDLLLIAINKNSPTQSQEIRTNVKGQATIVLNQKGAWLVKAVKIIHIEENDLDWKSHWASLTFELLEHL